MFQIFRFVELDTKSYIFFRRKFRIVFFFFSNGKWSRWMLTNTDVFTSNNYVTKIHSIRYACLIFTIFFSIDATSSVTSSPALICLLLLRLFDVIIFKCVQSKLQINFTFNLKEKKIYKCKINESSIML